MLRSHDVDRRDRGCRREVEVARQLRCRAGRRRGRGRRHVARHRLGGGGRPGSGVALDLGVERALDEVGADPARILQQRESAAPVRGAAVAKREHVCGDTEAIGLDGAAQLGRSRAQSGTSRGARTSALACAPRPLAGPAQERAARQRRKRRRRSLRAWRTPSSRTRPQPRRPRLRRDTPAPSPAPRRAT